MKNPYANTFSEAERKLVKRWTIAAAAAYGLIMAALLGLAVTHDWSNDDSEDSLASYSSSARVGIAAAPYNRLSQVQTNAVNATDGFNARTATAPAGAARVTVPEAGEMTRTPAAPQDGLVENGWDFNVPNGVPGFAPMQADSMPSAALPQLSARAKQ
jgi:hypothetical protein